jgi:hypothetical protein
MKKFYIALLAASFSLPAFSIHVVIIESQSVNPGHAMDVNWQASATSLGFTSEILPQSTLDTISNLIEADILVVASGTITLGSPDHIQTMIDFIQSGRGIYIQAEYTAFQPGTITFQAVMDALGLDFSWTVETSGSLTPMNVSGTLSTTPNTVEPLLYYHYGIAGEGEDVVPFLEYLGNNYGFICSDENNVNGTIITTSDQDWINNNASPELMENILVMLTGNSSHITALPSMENISVYPNPTIESALITTVGTMNDATVLLLNSVGQIAYMLESFTGNSIRIDCANLPAGIYFVRIKDKDMDLVERIVVE